jgi:4'-phosphopantetheinyl transferase
MPEPADRMPSPDIGAPRELRVGPVTARVWSLDLAQPLSPTAADLASLSDAERGRAAGLADVRARSRFILTRIWMRRILARESGVSPDRLDLRIGPYGKPYAAGCAGDRRLSFNLSHSGARALLGVCRQAEIGIDIERVREGLDGERVARRVFSAGEQAAWRSAAPGDRPAAFMRLWVRREASLKAHGSTVWRGLDSGFSASTWVVDLDEAAPYVAALAVTRAAAAPGTGGSATGGDNP